MEGYSAKIISASRELTAKEKIMFKDKSDAIMLDTVCEDGNHVKFTPVMYVELSIHNEKSERKDYENLLIVDTDGNRYVTGSPSFKSSFMDIWDEMKDFTDEPWGIDCYKLDSKNFKGKQFLTCSVM